MKKLSTILFVLALVITLASCKDTSSKVLKIDFKSAIAEHGSSPFSFASLTSLNGSGEMTLLDFVRAIDEAASDSTISMIYMTPDNLSAGFAQMEEVRASLARFRASGKQIVAYCENLNNASYYIASVADKIILNPASESYLMGIATQTVFLKDALDALGVEVQLIRHGKYKSAGEMFIRNDFSKENLEQNQAMINSLWNDMCEEIAGSRNFSKEEFRKWVDDLSLTDAQSFLDKGLVDELWHKDQVDDYFCRISDKPTVNLVGFVSLKQYADKIQRTLRKQSRKSMDNVAVVYADGEIVVSSNGSTGFSSGAAIVGKNLANTLAKVRKDDKIKAVVFRVNSPGGSVMASELIKREIDLLKEAKPVIASYGGYAASGGYWISAGTGHIFTDKTTLTGSIGCFSMIPNIGDAIRKNLKVNFATVGSSAHSDMMTGMRSLDKCETDYLQAQVEDIYDKFTTIVSEGRGISKDSVDAIAQGRVWTGSDAINIGLTDEIGGLTDAIAYAAASAGLDNYGVEEYPEIKPFSFMSLFSESDVVDESVTSDEDAEMSILLQNAFPLATFLRKQQEPVMMARLPYIVIAEN